MTDRSKIIRHPAVVREEFRTIRDSMAVMRMRLQELMDELDQVADVAEEMMSGVAKRNTPTPTEGERNE